MKDLIKKLKFKQPKYILPLVALPFILFIAYSANKFMKTKDQKPVIKEEFSTDLGQVGDSIKDKEDSYLDFFKNESDGRSMVGSINEEQDSLYRYRDNLSLSEKRYIDSLNFIKEKGKLNSLSNQAAQQQSYYSAQSQRQQQNRRKEDEEYERSMKMIELLNGDGNSNQNQSKSGNQNSKLKEQEEKQDDPVAMMRKQMLFLDSLEKAKDPQYQSQVQAEETLKRNTEKMDRFLNSTLKISKAQKNENFNSIYKQRETSFIKAVIDENIKGYLGSRIRIRLLENIYVGNLKIDAGTVFYAQISGFTLQRVNLNIVSVMVENEILPINLSIYDVDGMQGLYVPASVFREMTRTMGENSIQGMQMNMMNTDFFTNMLASLFQSTSKTIADLIRKNKVKVKYNSFVYLIDEQQLKQQQNRIYNNSK
jgi:conjugative transposon TraM protein